MKKSIIIAASALTAFLFASCGPAKGAAKKPGEKADEEIKFAVNVLETKAGNFDDYLEFGGDVTSLSSIDVMPDTAGKISRVLVNIGDKVKKDDILCYVDASRPGMNYAASPVKAPISGTVTSFPYTIGTTVAPSMAVAKISTTSELQIKVNVPERFISRIAERQTANVSFDAYPGEVFKAKVFEVSPVLDSVSRTMAIKLKIVPASPKIKVGMYARVKLITESMHDVIVLPVASIVYRDGVPYVFLCDEKLGKARQVPVRVGITVDNKIEIKDGVNPGDKVIIKGQTLLNDGSLVTVVSTTK